MCKIKAVGTTYAAPSFRSPSSARGGPAGSSSAPKNGVNRSFFYSDADAEQLYR